MLCWLPGGVNGEGLLFISELLSLVMSPSKSDSLGYQDTQRQLLLGKKKPGLISVPAESWKNQFHEK